MSDNWRPDWRDVATYPDPNAPIGTNSRNRWRWEFQRRDPDYQDDWAERANRPAGFWHERYGLTGPVDPASATASFVGWPLYWVQPRGAGDRTLQIIQRDGTALIQFDLTRPLQPQFERAEFILQSYTLDQADLRQLEIEAGFLAISNRRRGKGFYWQPKYWLRYLRLLDAVASGASKEEIVSVFYPKMSNDYPERTQDTHLRDDRRAARKMLKDRQYTLI